MEQRTGAWSKLPVRMRVAGGAALVGLSGSLAGALQFESIELQSGGMTVIVRPDPGDADTTWDFFSYEGSMPWGWLGAESVPSTGSLVVHHPLPAGGLCWVAAANAAIDTDGDVLSDGQEIFLHQTDPADADTDGDGLVDGSSGVVPTATVPGGVDRDGDGFADGESEASSLATEPDSDGDGIDDGSEWSNRTDPLNPDTAPPVVILHVFSSTLWLFP